MRVRFVVTSRVPDGGLSFATYRLATALAELGHECDVLIPATVELPGSNGVPVRTSGALPPAGRKLEDRQSLIEAMASGQPDLLVVGDRRPELLMASKSVAPTVLHSHLHWATCPDAGRYWHHLQRECGVQAGWKCLALRPLLGCSSRRQVVWPKPVADQRDLLQMLRNSDIGTIAIGSHQARLLLGHGVPAQAMTLIPNLGMRVSADDLERAALDVPPEDRYAIAFVGRLSKDKGAALLPAIASMLPPHSLRVFGDGYLGADLRDSLGSALRGYVTQDRLAGVLQWARAVVFPSMWPEPGGIAGIDAQLFGVPLGAFEMGAAKDWPKAALFAPGDTGDLGGWAGTQSQLNQPRDAADIACRQDRYWRSVALRASDGLTAFSATGRFPQLEMEAVREELRSAISLPSPLWGTSSSRRY